MPKYWGKQIFAHGRFPKVGQNQKTEKKREKDRTYVITMASYALQRHLGWRTQSRLGKNKFSALGVSLKWVKSNRPSEKKIFQFEPLNHVKSAMSKVPHGCNFVSPACTSVSLLPVLMVDFICFAQ